MADAPRRLPQRVDAERLPTIARRMAAGSDDGQTANARPVQRRRARPAPHVPGRASLAASATFRDPATGLALGALGAPSNMTDHQGGSGAYFAFDGSNGIVLLRDGWYQVAASAAISGATAGEAFRIFCYFTTPQTVEGLDIAAPGGACTPTCMSLPFYDDGSGTVLQVSVENHSGTSGQVDHPSIHVVAFS